MKCGSVAVVGRANAGKSTLVNVLVGEKVSITSPKPQTTRDRIYGVLTTENYQIVFEDTPGIYKASSLLNQKMQSAARRTAKETDLILFLIDGHAGIRDEDLREAKKFVNSEVPTILVFTKTDIMPKEKLPEELLKLSAVSGVKEIIPVSARKGTNVKELLGLILQYLPESEEYIFDENAVSDKSERFMLGEIMREKILLKFDKEVPHGVAVTVNDFSLSDNGIYNIDLDIICEKPAHKSIIIGKQGRALKEVNTFARQDMEKFLGKKVFLSVFVKVKENWRDRPELLEKFGYSTKNEEG